MNETVIVGAAPPIKENINREEVEKPVKKTYPISLI
jgi:hypothetical protein